MDGGPGLGAPDAGPRRPWLWFIGLAVLGTPLAFVAPFVFFGLLLLLIFSTIFVVTPGDATTVLSLGLAALYLIPQRYMFEPLGAAGTPAIMLGVGAFLWWFVSRVNGTTLGSGYNPVRITVFLMLATVLMSYVAAFVRPIVFLEASSADRSLIIFFGYAGFLLLATDGIPDRARLDALLRRLVWGTTYMSFVAILQFFSNNRIDLASMVQLPGLSYNKPEFGSEASYARGDFYRVFGTAEHPIEFSVVIAALLPLAVHYAFADRHRSLLARWAPVGIMGFAMPLAISRSGFLGMAIAGACIVPSLPASRRVVLAAFGFVAAAGMTVAVPGLLGTIRGFFFNASTDSSITARTEDYQYLDIFFAERPIAGRGIGTFIPTLYDFLDNQYLLSVIETGIIGLIGLIIFFVGSMATAQVVRKYSLDEGTRTLAQALFAAVLVHMVTFATYDALVFRTTGVTCFLVVGVIGALWRITREERVVVMAAREAALVEAEAEVAARSGR